MRLNYFICWIGHVGQSVSHDRQQFFLNFIVNPKENGAKTIQWSVGVTTH